MSGETEPAPSLALNRILITADTVGGVWQYTIDLARELAAEGVSVMIATMGPLPTDGQRRQLPLGVQLVTSEHALEWSADPWAEVDAAGQWLLSLCSNFHPRLVHLNGYTHADLPWPCPVLVVAHSCVVSWWHAVHRCDPGPEWNQYRQRVRAGLLACDAVVAPSNFMAREITRHYQVAPAKVQVVWNFSSTPAAAAPAKQPFCLAAGRIWDGAKNFGLLREVARQAFWPIELAGGESVEPFQPVRLLGHIPYQDLLARMTLASIFLHPAMYEPFGLAVLEAARAGCCLILSDTASARELWDGVALFADARTPSEWVSLLNRIGSDTAECRKWGRAAQQHSLRYSEERFRSSYKSIYRELLDRHAHRTEHAA